MAGTVYSDLITTNALPDAMRVIYSQDLEMTARPTLIFDQPAFVEPKNEFGAQRGQSVVWTTYRQQPAAITPLTENQDVGAGAVQDFQISFSISEFGYAWGVSEKLDLLSYHGPISNIVRSLAGPHMAVSMDTVCRNVLWNAPNLTGGVTYRDYPNSKTARSALGSSDVITAELIRWLAYNLSNRRVPPIATAEPAYVALAHPGVIYDLRHDANWINAQLYAGATRIFNGEEGMIHGVRFLKSDRARIANGGAIVSANGQTTLSASYPAGIKSITVGSVAGLAVGDEVTLHNTGVSSSVTISGSPVSWYAPDGQDGTAEEVIISSITGNTLTLRQATMLPHSAGDYCTEATDIYPIAFAGGVPPMGKGLAVAPEVRVSLPTDKLRRTSYVGWYALQGYGVVRDWAYEMLEVTASVASALPYGI